jgi:hypothetical protein
MPRNNFPFNVPRRESSRLPEPQRQRVTERFARTLKELEEEELNEQPYRVVQVLLKTEQVTIAPRPVPACDVETDIVRKFEALAEQWYLETMASSSYLDKILHPAYQKIMVLGVRAVPLILRELQAMPNDWFWALRMLTEEDPVTPDQAGNMAAMADAWLRWGKEKGHV